VIVICDIDGTLACLKRRSKKAGHAPEDRESKDFKDWLGRLMKPEDLLKDKPIKEVVEIVQALFRKHNIVYLTGRGEKHRGVTQEWLKKNGLPEGPLYMRTSKYDTCTPGEYKGKMLKRIINLYGCHGIAIDDDDDSTTSAIYLKYGFKHLKVIT
jgi:hypothetical protein